MASGKPVRNEVVFKRILVPADRSLSSVIAQQMSALIGEKFHSDITVLHVASHGLMRPELTVTLAEIYKPIQLNAQYSRERALACKEGKKSISEAASLFGKKGVVAKMKLVEHVDPAEAIIEEAERGDYDLVVMGQSDRGQEKPHLGSVAEKVSQYARTSVLIARGKSSVSRILVPVDGSENAREALEYAVALAAKTGASITLLHVTERSLFKPRIGDPREIGALVLSKAAAHFNGAKISKVLESGNPAKIITRMADEKDCDLIIMGSKGQGARIRFWLGSVSSHVIHYANRSVLLVPMRQEKQGSISQLSPEGTVNRLVNLFVASRSAVGSYVREKMGEESLHSMFEHESEKFSKGLEKIVWRADDIAKDMIRLNFQPFGMEAKYSGNSEKATIVVSRCPLPQKFLQSVEFLKEFTFEQKGARMDELFSSIDKVSSSWDWPPKKTEVCATCRITMPKLGKKLGFTWKHQVTKAPPECIFNIEITGSHKT